MKNCVYLFFISILILNLSNQKAYAIKIGLMEQIAQATLGASQQAYLINARTGEKIYTMSKMKAYRFRPYKSTIAIEFGGKSYDTHANALIIKPQKRGFVNAKNNWYRGELLVLKRNNTLTIINNVPLEEYILGVVPSEMPSRWDIEAHKAQAIAARSYAIANLGKRKSSGFDLKDTPEDQAYGGALKETQRTTAAVKLTDGIVITYNKKIIPAYYCASAGGKTSNSGDVWMKNLPYLKSVPSYDSNISKNGHGVGMSQHGANNLAKKGYNAYQILNYFYKGTSFGRLEKNWAL